MDWQQDKKLTQPHLWDRCKGQGEKNRVQNPSIPLAMAPKKGAGGQEKKGRGCVSERVEARDVGAFSTASRHIEVGSLTKPGERTLVPACLCPFCPQAKHALSSFYVEFWWAQLRASWLHCKDFT